MGCGLIWVRFAIGVDTFRGLQRRVGVVVVLVDITLSKPFERKAQRRNKRVGPSLLIGLGQCGPTCTGVVAKQAGSMQMD